MKKKAIALIAFSLVLGLTACGEPSGETESTGQESQPQTVESTQQTESTETAQPEESSAAEDDQKAAEEKQQSDYVQLVQETVSLSHIDRDNYRRTAEVNYGTVTLSAEDEAKYPELAKVLKQQKADDDKEGAKLLESLMDSYEEAGEWVSAVEGMYFYENTKDFVTRADSRVVSVVHVWDSYWGGAHGMYSNFGETYATATGKRLAFSDVVKDMDKFFALADEQLKTEYNEIYEDLSSLDEYRGQTDFTDSSLNTWVMDNEGVSYYFGPYVLGSYAMGDQMVKVYFDQHPEIFNEAYLPIVDSYILPVTGWLPVYIDTDGDGKREDVYVEPVYQNEWIESWIVHAGNRSLNFQGWGYEEKSYIVKKNNQYYLYLFMTAENDYVTLEVIDLKTLHYDEEKNVSGSLMKYNYDYDSYEDGKSYYKHSQDAFTNPEAFVLDSTIHMMGTYGCFMTYRVGEDGYPVSADEYLQASSARIMKAKTDVTCKTVDESGNVTGETVIPKDAYVFIVRTDGKTWVDLQIVPDSIKVEAYEDWEFYYSDDVISVDANSPYLRIVEDSSSYPFTINGVDESEVFGGIAYAG